MANQKRKELLARVAWVQQQLNSWQIDALLIENPYDLYYLTGLELSKGRLILQKEKAALWVDGRYFGNASAQSLCPVHLWEKGEPSPALPLRVGLDSSCTTVESLERLTREFSSTEWVKLSMPLRMRRMIKDPLELVAMEKAAHVTWQGVQHLQRTLKEWISERELAAEFDCFVLRAGASGLAFSTNVSFGLHSAFPHHHPSDARLEQNSLVLVDVGAKVDAYCGDVTRTFLFGNPSTEIQAMRQLVREAAFQAEKKAKIGVPLGELDRAARDVFAREGVEELFTHGLGHGIGLEVHEPPRVRWDGEDRELRLEKNMFFTIEPGLYRVGVGGIRYENTGVMTEEGFRSLYPQDPR